MIAALVALGLDMLARVGRDMDLEKWAVGGRGFGWIFVFLLPAGEIYTTFTFLGASGFSYGLGAPAYYILAYGSLAYVIAYFLLPLVANVIVLVVVSALTRPRMPPAGAP